MAILKEDSSLLYLRLIIPVQTAEWIKGGKGHCKLLAILRLAGKAPLDGCGHKTCLPIPPLSSDFSSSLNSSKSITLFKELGRTETLSGGIVIFLPQVLEREDTAEKENNGRSYYHNYT